VAAAAEPLARTRGVKSRELRFEASRSSGEVSAFLVRPRNATCLLVFAHGAGAGMRHAFMEAAAERLAERGLATLRYQFPYMEQGRRAPSPRGVLLATVRAAVDAAAKAAPGLPLLAGGKSMGGRMTSLAASDTPLPGVRGLVFFGFPLHAAGKPASERGAHLDDVRAPMLFLQGTRDSLADLSLIEPLCSSLGERATLHVVDGGDHSFHVLKRSGRTDEEVLDEIADRVSSWAESVV
jgi:predicted alpha/beta-hydrolase family hydrolase